MQPPRLRHIGGSVGRGARKRDLVWVYFALRTCGLELLRTSHYVYLHAIALPPCRTQSCSMCSYNLTRLGADEDLAGAYMGESETITGSFRASVCSPAPLANRRDSTEALSARLHARANAVRPTVSTSSTHTPPCNSSRTRAAFPVSAATIKLVVPSPSWSSR
jgi:hypothetical protein